MTTAIVVHGGAGAWGEVPERLTRAMPACIAAAQAGQAILLAGGSALDAVETAVNILENEPVLDAGRGSYPNANGEIEMDALIMDGSDLNLGAVAAVTRVQNPISLARKVLEHPNHNFLVGAGAEAFADQIGFPRCEVADLLTDENLLHYHNHKNTTANEAHGDTVGAVAIDSNGNIATATSTGGTRHKLPGRVGDSPLVGSGGYADNWTAAVSATGHGEALMKIIISKRVCDLVGDGLSAQAACDAAIQMLAERVQGTGGLIAVDARGQVGVARNTNAMPYAYAIDDKPIVSGK
ncbi:MAG: isoaspartyl peptidase/L-asparaginase [Ardenticatenaceae bacterium]|nr:isoaspartyl peptidase/L-asparaginase [Ardenticatenaceae bacterium]MCB9446395.1 isoaspartyl peptidase/L-asparaginase [Ardenticatenaceae bacterium]